MRYLLDTHILIWWLEENKKLKPLVKKIIVNPHNQLFVSTINAIEISIKKKSGKLKLQTTIQKMFQLSGCEVLNLHLDHALQLEKLPLYHKDPFDRILIAQAQVENLTILSTDPKFKQYKVKLLS